jgi:outer membrane lipoprotein SlyB
MDNPNNTPSNQSSRRLHPLVATAAGAVIVASLAATAAITGLFPKASSDSAQSNQTQAAQIASQPVIDTAQPAAPAPAQQQAQQQPTQQPVQAVPVPVPAQPPTQAQYAQQPVPQPQQYAPPQQAPRPAACQSCGTVVAISEVRQEGHGTGIGAVGGAVAGGVIGNQFGHGGGRTAMTLLGAVGGGFAGNSVEKHLRTSTAYSVRVRMETGKYRYFTFHEAPPFQQGERVRIENGTLVAG